MFILALALALLAAAPAPPAATPATLPAVAHIDTLPDGMTVAVRRVSGAPNVALQVWIRCPSDGFGPPKPGIARLSALSVAAQKYLGTSLRDQVRMVGGQMTVSVFADATQFSIYVPAFEAERMEGVLLQHVFRSPPGDDAFKDARARLAEQQVVSESTPDLALRDALFGALFSDGPQRSSTYGTPAALRAMTVVDVRAYVARAYVPGAAMAVAVGALDADAIHQAIAAGAPPAAGPAPGWALAPSVPAKATGVPLPALKGVDGRGVAIGWAGPPIADERAATALDFLADYIARPDYGMLQKPMRAIDARALLAGEFITLHDAGVFYLGASGDELDVAAAQIALQQSLSRVIAAPLDKDEFARAIEAFRTHMLRDTQSALSIADNYGWYFVEGAPAYSPSAGDRPLDGDYFARVASLTPAFVRDVAARYLTAPPTIVIAAPTPSPLPSAAPGAASPPPAPI